MFSKTTKSMEIKELILEKVKEEKREKAARNLNKASILTDEQIAAAWEVSVVVPSVNAIPKISF